MGKRLADVINEMIDIRRKNHRNKKLIILFIAEARNFLGWRFIAGYGIIQSILVLYCFSGGRLWRERKFFVYPLLQK